MSTGRSAAKREAKQQRALIAEQTRETQKQQASEESIKRESLAGLKRKQGGRMSLLDQQTNLSNKLGVS